MPSCKEPPLYKALPLYKAPPLQGTTRTVALLEIPNVDAHKPCSPQTTARVVLPEGNKAQSQDLPPRAAVKT